MKNLHKGVENMVLKTVTAMYFNFKYYQQASYYWYREVSKKLESLWVFVSNININRIKIIEHYDRKKSSDFFEMLYPSKYCGLRSNLHLK